ncbi:hypothetical protein SAMN02745244_00647 [Tessaracoccus bendigoensis DSM 12906]|uniref:Uncharacterized protein n=1 Tax=Tessaracoccus bendigoensis DSM 12906 TaxID=1123357 RepID=A0A1M6CBG8_9ACTN|nr:hypothetical protein [Tessaracoccus bendigoensis]SHI58346.1 hypothetical protein SAMN02745244_00647 [Tessaracoccus bendigoensis DSM 12906]
MGRRLSSVLAFLSLAVVQVIVNYAALVLALFTIVLLGSGAAAITGQPVWTSLAGAASLLPHLLLFTLVMSLIRALVRAPLIVVFGSLVLRTFGLFLVLIDMVVFTITAAFVPLTTLPPDQTWWGIPVTVVLFLIFSLGIATVLGLNRPLPNGARPHAEIWRLLGRVPGLRRGWFSERLRQSEVLNTLGAYLLEFAVANTVIERPRRWLGRLTARGANPLDGLSTPAKIRVMLEQLGPTYVKLGQLALSRP